MKKTILILALCLSACSYRIPVVIEKATTETAWRDNDSVRKYDVITPHGPGWSVWIQIGEKWEPGDTINVLPMNIL